MFRVFVIASVLFVVATLSTSSVQAQQRHRVHQVKKISNGGHRQLHIQHWNYGRPHCHKPLVVRRPVVQVQVPVVRVRTHVQAIPVAPQYFGPGHFRYKTRFHTLVTKNRLPLEVRWNEGRYWIRHNQAWVVYDDFVKGHCGGNWDWYLSKHRKKYGF